MIEGLDPVIHAPKRLALMSLLASTLSGASFAFLRDHLDLTDSDLSKQMSALEAAGYAKAHKSGRGRGSVTTFTTTRAGRKAYDAHRKALIALLTAVDAPVESQHRELQVERLDVRDATGDGRREVGH